MLAKRMTNLDVTVILLAVVPSLPAIAAAPPITYQGQLKFNGVPYDGLADFSFSLYDRLTGGTRLCTDAHSDVDVENGLFTVELSLTGIDCFNGQPRWLQIWVSTPDGDATLDPRQPITSAPYALYAFDAPGGGGFTLPYEGTCPPASGDAFRINQPGSTANAIVADATGDESKGLVATASGYEGAALEASATGAANFAVMGTATGVGGSADNHGGYFLASGAHGRGVAGHASEVSGINYGVYGQTMSSEGYGGYFLGRGYFRDPLGIGVTDPAEMLDVAGTVQATGLKLTTAPAAGWVLTSDSSGVGTWQPAGSGGSCYWNIDPEENLYYGNGNVGINFGAAQTPLYPLHVLGTAAVTDLKIGDAATPGDVLTADANGFGTWQAPSGGGSSVWEVDPEENIYYGNGNVGINFGAAQTPLYPLHVNGTTATTSLKIGDFATPGHVLTADANGYGTWQAPSGGGSCLWQLDITDDSITYNDGRVGIGVITPTENLEVNGVIKTTGFQLTTAPTAGHVLTADASGLATWQAPPSGSSSVWDVDLNDNIYYSDGFVGINMGAGLTPQYPLQVDGTIKMNGLKLGDSAVAGRVLTTDASGVGTWQNPPPTYWYDGPDDDIYYDDGKVGIWTGTPAYPLDVGGTVSMDGFKLGDTATSGYVLTADASGVGTWQPSAGGGSSFWKDGPDDDIYYDDGAVGIGTTGAEKPVQMLHVKGSGYFRDSIGIGVTNPAHPLHVIGDADPVVSVESTSTTSLTSALAAQTGANDGRAVYGHATATASNAAGGYFESDSIYGHGVRGRAEATEGAAIGGFFSANAPDAKGVIGRNNALTGNSVGVQGYTESTSGRAVFGWAAGTSGENYGIYGQSNSPDGFAGYFNGNGYFSGKVGIGVEDTGSTPLKVVKAPDTGASPAITGTASGNSVTGVYGFVSDSADYCVGVRGESSSPTGTGVKGKGTSQSGVNIGVHGLSDSPEGRGVQGENNDGGWAGFFKGPVLVTSGLGSGPAAPEADLDVEGTVKMDGFQLTAAPSAGYVLTSDANGVGTWQESTGGGSFDLPVDETVDADGQTALKITNTGSGLSTNGIAAVINNTGSDETSAGLFTVVGSGNAVTATSEGGYAVYATGDGIAVWGSSSGAGGGSFRSTQDGGHGVKGTSTSSGTSSSNRGGWFEASGSNGRGVYARTTGAYGRAVQAVAEGGEGIGVYAEAPWTALEARSSYNAAKFYGDVRIYEYGTTNRIFHVDDSTGVTTVKVLQLEGGADLAEPFDVAADDVSAKPGMVVTIDPQNVGKLVVSQEAYDSKVAGVISGAGGIKPGMVMGQKGSIAHGEHPIALTGRVWTLCDASDAAIQPGDLLTTSSTPGHAMKVIDSARAQGAIIGKAMSRLVQGERGLVLVLVSLQ